MSKPFLPDLFVQRVRDCFRETDKSSSFEPAYFAGAGSPAVLFAAGSIVASAVKAAFIRSTSDSSASAPLFTVSVAVPSLGPYQSKEIKTDLDAGLRSASIPEWENLRADVQVSTKP